ncbi:MAG TPA: nucleotidyltransferase domain-containing protein [Campylobacterales bacterium]|nr:nucleotidyltransferase domain-containing protein [Campylobacterales bacterium]
MQVTDYVTQKSILKYLKEIKPQLQKNGIEKIGLFGSYATEKADIYSDIDLAFQLQKEYLEKRSVWEYFDLREKIQHMITQKFHLKCDLLDLDSNSDIKESIEKELIYA